MLQNDYKNIAKMLQKMHSKNHENTRKLLILRNFLLSKCRIKAEKCYFCRKRKHESV